MVSHKGLLTSETYSEERTEPMSQSEIDARIKSIRMGLDEPDQPIIDETISLDVLQLEEHHHRQGIRLLMRPLTKLRNPRSVSPGSDSCQWIQLRAEVASLSKPEHTVLAVTQTSKDIKFSVRIPGEIQNDLPRPALWCELYYDPASDRVILWNKSDVPLSLSRVSQTPSDSPSSETNRVMIPGVMKALNPGTWRIKVRDIAVLDFRILEKRPVTIYQAYRPESQAQSSALVSSTRQSTSGTKRSLDDEDESKRVKRRTADNVGREDDGAIMFLRPGANDSDSLVFPLPNARESKELAADTSNPILDADRNETVFVPGVCELDRYQLTKQESIASAQYSAVFKAHYSHVPDDIVTVKVLKTRVANPGDKPHVHERNVIRQADMWLRESQSQGDLQHGSIVKYYGGDARFLSLYMEHVDAKDLTDVPRWRSRANEEFQGSREDSWRILRDISEALKYLHGRQLVHNDIKPANILYSPERGAVLIDFGLSTPASKAPSSGGTPYYVPPEFIGRKIRGPASDVWALGVTMLYLLRKISFPDSRARQRHPKPLYWQIAGIHNPQAQHRNIGNGQPAVDQMREWLGEVREARDGLDRHDCLEDVVFKMLTPNPHQRITMAKVVDEMNAHQAVQVTTKSPTL